MGAGTVQKKAALKKKAAPMIAKRGGPAKSGSAAHRIASARRRPTPRTHSEGYLRSRNTTSQLPVVQTCPTPERFREIQSVLAARGYLKTHPSGVWDDDSRDAMIWFQQDQNLEATGKLTARSLAALGLGPGIGLWGST